MAFGKITSKSLELRRGPLFWEHKWLEESEAKWRTTQIPCSLGQAEAADRIAHMVMAQYPASEMVGLTMLVRKDVPEQG